MLVFDPLNKIVIKLRIHSDTDQTKGNSGSSHEAHGARPDTERSSAKVRTTPGSPPQTNAHTPASCTNTAPLHSKDSTYYVPHGVANPPSPPPLPLPPKPDELKREMSNMGPPRIGRKVTTSPGGYPSPSPSPSRGQGQTSHHSPTGSPDDYPSFTEPQYSATHDSIDFGYLLPDFGYPSPDTSPESR